MSFLNRIKKMLGGTGSKPHSPKIDLATIRNRQADDRLLDFDKTKTVNSYPGLKIGKLNIPRARSQNQNHKLRLPIIIYPFFLHGCAQRTLNPNTIFIAHRSLFTLVIMGAECQNIWGLPMG